MRKVLADETGLRGLWPRAGPPPSQLRESEGRLDRDPFCTDRPPGASQHTSARSWSRWLVAPSDRGHNHAHRYPLRARTTHAGHVGLSPYLPRSRSSYIQRSRMWGEIRDRTVKKAQRTGARGAGLPRGTGTHPTRVRPRGRGVTHASARRGPSGPFEGGPPRAPPVPGRGRCRPRARRPIAQDLRSEAVTPTGWPCRNVEVESFASATGSALRGARPRVRRSPPRRSGRAGRDEAPDARPARLPSARRAPRMVDRRGRGLRGDDRRSFVPAPR